LNRFLADSYDLDDKAERGFVFAEVHAGDAMIEFFVGLFYERVQVLLCVVDMAFGEALAVGDEGAEAIGVRGHGR